VVFEILQLPQTNLIRLPLNTASNSFSCFYSVSEINKESLLIIIYIKWDTPLLFYFKLLYLVTWNTSG